MGSASQVIRRGAGVEESRTEPAAVPRPVPPTVEGARAGFSRPDRDALVRLAYRFVWNHHDAEDVVHDALTAAQQKRAQLKEPDKWSAWVCRIVIQRALLTRRRKLTWRGHLAGFFRRQKGLPSESGPGKRIETRELGGILKTLLAELPEKQRTAVVLRHLEGIAYRRIAEIMEISESTARVHVRAGREALREMILKRYPEWADVDERQGG
jgi:RNA polymerase sigma-70 factor (ECF subfamily)